MIHGLSKHTKNAGSAVAYFLDDKYFKLLDHSEVDLDDYDPKAKRGDWLQREPKPVLLEGDPAQLTALCDSLSFKNRYTSGVLSFSPEETARIAATPGMKEQLIEELRAYAYAGVKNDDSKPLLVVQHEHTGRLELHYLIPRVSLESGKYFNPFPPNYDGRRGKGANSTFIEQDKTFVDYVCSKYGLQNPRDPKVAREIKFNKFDNNKSLKLAINERVSKLVASGSIQSSGDVVKFLKEAGGTITRRGEDYISVKFDYNKKSIRLKGAYYSEQSFAESRQSLRNEGKRISRSTQEIDSAYEETLLTRSREVEKIHNLKGVAAERADDFDRKSALELGEYADELKALKDNLPDSAGFSRRVSDSIISSPELATGNFDGIETGVASGTSDADPILTGNPGSDQLIRAFHSMQKKLAAEELQRSKAKWQIDPQHEKIIREISDTMAKLFGGLAVGKNLVHGRPGAMTPAEIGQVRQMLQEQRRELDRELRAVAQVVKQKERIEPLRELMKPEPERFEAKNRPVPAPLPAHLVKLVDKHAVLKPAQDIDHVGGIKTLRSGWLSDKSHAIQDEALLWSKKHDPADVERGIVAAMARQKVPPQQAYQAVLEESAVVRGDAHYAADLVAQEYTRSALQAEGKPEAADLRAEAQTRYAELYKRADSGTDAELRQMREQSRKDAQAEQQRLDEQKEKQRLALLERRAAERLEGGLDSTPGLKR